MVQEAEGRHVELGAIGVVGLGTGAVIGWLATTRVGGLKAVGRVLLSIDIGNVGWRIPGPARHVPVYSVLCITRWIVKLLLV